MEIRSPRVQLAIAGAACLALATVLAWFPPQRYGFYPSCPIQQWLGIPCPGCGITRAMVELMRGHFRAAAEYNVLIFAAVPLAAAFGWLQSYSVWRWNRWRPVHISIRWIAAANAVVLLFGLSRIFSGMVWNIR